ncbi:MAG TPA: hypothetical protein VFY71_05115 [Planctomycetota bacterium]|nr:hypothetical protein [Planctomycetota bacterium]
MTASWGRLALFALLAVVLLASVGAVLGVLGGLVLLPQLGAVGWVAIGLLLFIGVQLALFRLFGLRSRADEHEAGHDTDDDEPQSDGERDERAGGDWRAWRG